METEQWKDIRGYEGFYQCSTLGRVRSVSRTIVQRNGRPRRWLSKMLTAHFNTNGYLWVYLNKDDKKEFKFVHRLIAETFIPNPKQEKFVNHVSGVKTENGATNLAWVSRKENIGHAFSTGLISHAGEKNSQSKLTAERVATIRQECPPRTPCTKVLAAKYEISKRRLWDVINDPACWKAAA